MSVLSGLSVDGATVGFTTGGVDVGSAGVGPERPAALLVHGAGMNRTVWQQQTRYLNHHGATALAVDLPGHGNSAGAPLATVAEMAAWLVRLADEVVVRLGGAPAGRRVALVGHSMGSLVCLEAAATAPDRFSRLVLAGTAMSMPVHPDLLDAAERNEPLAAELMTAWGHGPAAHVAASPTPGMWMLGGGLALLAAAADGVIFADLSACDAYEVGDAAGRVECPVTVVVGGADKMTPPRAAAPLIAGFDSADVVHLADVGHMMMSEDPAAVRRALRAALCG